MTVGASLFVPRECRPHFHMWSKAAWPGPLSFHPCFRSAFFFLLQFPPCLLCCLPIFSCTLLVLTRVLHSDLFSPPTLIQPHLSFLFRCSFCSVPCTYWGLWPRGMLLGRAPISLSESLPWLPRWILFLVYTVSLFLNGILSICSCSFL